MKNNQKINYKIGDVVIVISGSHKNSSGEIVFIDEKKATVLVKGVNIVNKCIRPDALNPVGKIIRKENPIHFSNIKLTTNKIS
jgi:large subunit ribosomal protein L24